jgi:nitrate reductase delta subunit
MIRAARSSELYQSLSLLLRYPAAELLAADSEIDSLAGSFPTGARDRIREFVAYRGRTPLIDLEREYVETFDTRRRCTLNVSYYLYGDTRRRGLALLRLRRMYAAAGLISESEELPDHLPLMLEFCAFASPEHGAHVLERQRVGIELLRLALESDRRPHAGLLQALCDVLPRLGVGHRNRIAQLVAQGPPDEQVGLEPFAPPEVMPTGARS